mmetsp:Transcript_69831/g.188124  ORF Transcript_69831/g.188124 Transcript_69831/m.188124 type:complete len:401 (+) Transcript_69831:3-1205(+)
MMIIADVVFGHMLVVASGSEWERAQSKPRELQALKQRLSQAVGPTFDADDFQWPWFKMEGRHWDNDNRYEGWGNGEWSELRHCPKVVEVHKQHLQTLLDAGVRGIRFDAVKHMRPAHLAEYVGFLRQPGRAQHVYIYGEVLSVDESMHREYMDPLSMPTTDFCLTVFINAAVKAEGGAAAAAAGARAAAVAAAASEGLDVVRSGAVTAATGQQSAPVLSVDSVRFARNHDTVKNPGSFYGLDSGCARARVVWAWLLSVHDGTVLMYPDDLMHPSAADLLKRALRFRAQSGICAEASEVCLRSISQDGSSAPRPALVTVTLRNHEGRIEGVCLLNVTQDAELVVGSLPLRSSAPEEATALLAEGGSLVVLQADGKITDQEGVPQRLRVQPWDAVFLVEAPL